MASRFCSTTTFSESTHTYTPAGERGPFGGAICFLCFAVGILFYKQYHGPFCAVSHRLFLTASGLDHGPLSHP